MKPLNTCIHCGKSILPAWKTCTDCDLPLKHRNESRHMKELELIMIDTERECFAEKKIIDLENRLQDAMYLLTKYQDHFIKR